jgi:hypothetical protein
LIGVLGAVGAKGLAARSSVSVVSGSRERDGGSMGGGKLFASSVELSIRDTRLGGEELVAGPVDSGCSGHEPFDGISGNGIARGAVSAMPGPRAPAAAEVARTILASTTTSEGPPTIKRCSTLSRRTRINRRRPSTLA